MRYWFALSAFVASATAALKVQLTSAAFPIRQFEGYTVWQITDGAASNTSIFGGVTLKLEPVNDIFSSGRYRQVSDHDFPGGSYYGEFVVGHGTTSKSTTENRALSLSISGLSGGTHTLMAYHNAWDALTTVSTLDVAVNGTNQQVSLKQIEQNCMLLIICNRLA